MGSIHPLLASRLIYWAQKFKGHIHFYFSQRIAPVDRARNTIVEQFLQTKVGVDKQHFTHLFMIDSDTIPEEDALARLLSHDKEIVTGLTPILNYNREDGDYEVYDNCFESREVDPATGNVLGTNIVKRHTGLHTVFRCGASCILIAREVFDKVGTPAFNFIPNEANTQHVRSEDIDFCDKAREVGITIYADSDVVCRHQKEVML
ncbi:hypothetical protein E3V39_12530 [Gammaproteobacteria bacterium LSUCC0112]|nr:hypothetical protein E3V39_12530 [Gammaproteobacteria bacterium LSUCC0112]